MSYELKITSHFWKKDTNSLYDYDTTDLTTSMIKIKKKCQLFQNGKYLKAVQDSNSIEEKSPYYIGNIYMDSDIKNSFKFKVQDDLYIKPPECNPKVSSDNWLILRHTYSKNDVGFQLREGVMIKLGKVVFKVREVSVGDERSELEKLDLNYNETKLHLERNPTNNEILSNNENFEDYDENCENDDPDEEIENNLNMSSNNNNGNLTNDAISCSKNLTNVPMYTHHHDMTNPYNQINFNTSHNMTTTTVINIKRKKSGMKYPINKLQSIYNKDKPIKKPSNTYTNICRICLGDGTEDILVSVCKCMGSVKYIHLACLRRWLISKIHLKTFNHLTVYSYKSLECELCKSSLSDTITLKNKTINLINLNSITESGNLKGVKKITNFIALECIKERPNNSSADQVEKKTVYIINMKEKTSLKIGRSTESDVRMTDISVSRHHAVLNIENGQMFLKDINSKFGTHVNLDLNQEIIVLPYKKLAVQCGRFYLLFELVKTCLAYLKCLLKKDNLKLWEDYNDYLNHLNKEKVIESGIKETIIEREKQNTNTRTAHSALQSVKNIIRPEKEEINENETNLIMNTNLQNLNTANNQLIINTNMSLNVQAVSSVPNVPIQSRPPLINPLINKEEINHRNDRNEHILIQKEEVIKNLNQSNEKEIYSGIKEDNSNIKEINYKDFNQMKKLNLRSLNIINIGNPNPNMINSNDDDKEFYNINIVTQPHPHGRNNRNGTVYNFSSRLNQYNNLQCKKTNTGQETEDLTVNKYPSHRGISKQMTHTETENYFVEDSSIPGMKKLRLIKNNLEIINKNESRHEEEPDGQREIRSPSFSPRP
jgi:hypothetical protein